MALPTLNKTYTITANTATVVTGTVFKQKMLLAGKIVNDFVNGGWTINQYSNATFDTSSPAPGPPTNPLREATNGSWTTGLGFATSSYGVADAALPNASHFPWVVLQNASLGNFQLLISNNGAVTSSSFLVRFSNSGGFSGGSNGAHPTASDQVELLNGAFFDGNDAVHKVHTWVSTDLEVTRAVVWRATTNLCLYIEIQKPRNAVSGWTNPVMINIAVAGAGIAMSYATLASGGSPGARGRVGSTTMNLQWTAETDRSATAFFPEQTDIGTVVNDLTSAWAFFPIGLSCKTFGAKGRHGALNDLYWRPTSVADGDTFPNDAAHKEWVAAGPLIFPWKGDGTAMDLT